MQQRKIAHPRRRGEGDQQRLEATVAHALFKIAAKLKPSQGSFDCKLPSGRDADVNARGLINTCFGRGSQMWTGLLPPDEDVRIKEEVQSRPRRTASTGQPGVDRRNCPRSKVCLPNRRALGCEVAVLVRVGPPA